MMIHSALREQVKTAGYNIDDTSRGLLGVQEFVRKNAAAFTAPAKEA